MTATSQSESENANTYPFLTAMSERPDEEIIKRSNPNAAERAAARHRQIQEMRCETERIAPAELKRFDAVAGAMVVLTSFFLAMIVGYARLLYRVQRLESATLKLAEKPPSQIALDADA